jgi:hypothetical protein
MQGNTIQDIGPRIKHFAKRCYRTQSNFCEVIGIDATQMSYYVGRGRVPGGDVLFRFFQAGMSIDWLFKGGDDSGMFADNAAGERLRQERTEFKETMNNVNILPREAHQAIAETKVIKIDDYQNNLAILQNFISFMRESAK